MATDYITAIDQIIGLVVTEWTAGAQAASSHTSEPTLLIMGRHRQRVPEVHNGPWGRLTWVNDPTNQSSLGGFGGRLFQNTGVVTLATFTPYKGGASWSIAQSFGEFARKIFQENQTSDVFFTRPTLQEVGEDGPWYMVNGIARYNFTERT